MKKTQMMICKTGRIRTQLPTALYQRMRRGLVAAEEWDSQKVQCQQCSKPMAASFLCCHLADQHKIYQEVVVAEELLEARVAVTYPINLEPSGRLVCLVPRCAGVLHGGWMLRQHFRDLHPLDRVLISKERYFPRCEWCAMQVNPAYP